MKKLLFSVGIIFFTITSTAQEVETIVVNGAEVTDFIAKQGYKYPVFQKGRVYFVNSDSGGGKLNLNYLLQTMQFLNPVGDTLVMDNETSIKYMTIGTDSFFYDEGFLEKITSAANVSLLKKSSLTLNGDPQLLGAFGKPALTTAVISQDVLRSEQSTFTLNRNQEYRFTRRTAFYLNAGNKGFVELNKKNIERLFSNKAGAIDNFIRQQNINLKKEADVLRLFAFISQDS
jgi:hypothetical protein